MNMLRSTKKIVSTATCFTNVSQKRFGSYANVGLGSADGGFEKDRIPKAFGEENTRDYTYFVLGGARFVYASAARLALIKFVSSMSASADVLALASAEFDISSIPVGSTLTVKWRGKPVFIRHRTEDEIAKETSVPISSLKDAQSDADRAKSPEWYYNLSALEMLIIALSCIGMHSDGSIYCCQLIVLGICTHLGCVPISGAGDYGGWFCPCHGSHYDTAGRIRKGPAPLNLEIPPYVLDDDGKLTIG